MYQVHIAEMEHRQRAAEVARIAEARRRARESGKPARTVWWRRTLTAVAAPLRRARRRPAARVSTRTAPAG